ncbi:MAG: shikimate dehydrogenase, partial [Phycisphaeraceae bacterium]|nr:shikimate dehydrogenase [Phycisphaeraceae bacterium]
MTHLAVAIFVHSVEQALAAASMAAEHGADMVEYRLDAYQGPAANLARLAEQSPLPCLWTCRPTWEGGQFVGEDEKRLPIFEAGLASKRPPIYVDLELAAYQKNEGTRKAVEAMLASPNPNRPGPHDTGLILSSHDFTGRPRDLLQRIEAMAQTPGCRVVKVAWQARSLRDNLEAFEALLRRTGPTIALCMGEYGLPSRVLAKKFGALLTFASLDTDQGTAPGQPTLHQLKHLYRWDAINAQTAVYGVIGHPVGHSMSPAVHNAGFAAAGINAVYLPMPIPPEYEHFKATVGSFLAMPELHFRGASVTIPHKENLLRFVEESRGKIEPLAKQIGAANTLTVLEDGSLYASNTDYAAALHAVCDSLDVEPPALAPQRVAVLGAGGAARAIVAGFAHHGANVVIYNRTLSKARALAEEFSNLPGKVVAAPMEKLCQTCCPILINCTPVGMHPNERESPVPAEFFSGTDAGCAGPGTVVFDTIYNPIHTRLLREARQAGCVTIPGTEMFVRQAAAQFELWTKHEAPLELFRR